MKDNFKVLSEKEYKKFETVYKCLEDNLDINEGFDFCVSHAVKTLIVSGYNLPKFIQFMTKSYLDYERALKEYKEKKE